MWLQLLLLCRLCGPVPARVVARDVALTVSDVRAFTFLPIVTSIFPVLFCFPKVTFKKSPCKSCLYRTWLKWKTLGVFEKMERECWPQLIPWTVCRIDGLEVLELDCVLCGVTERTHWLQSWELGGGNETMWRGHFMQNSLSNSWIPLCPAVPVLVDRFTNQDIVA